MTKARQENNPFKSAETTTCWHSFDLTVQIVKTRHADVKTGELQVAIEEVK
jgi:hypothetical protein